MSFDQALALAYRYLNRRERTVAETAAHLHARGVPEDLAGQVIAELSALGCLDDVRFARLFVQDRRALSQWGDDRIRIALRERGVEREQVERALCESPEEDSQRDRALAILRQRMPSPASGRRTRERALGLLLRRGYDYDLATEVIRAHMSQ